MFSLFLILLALLLPALAQFCPLPNTLAYHTSVPLTVRSFQGVYGSNFNETITFCDFKVKAFELNTWNIIPVIAQSADSGQSQYNEKGALLYGGTYVAVNGSIVWKGLGFSANGPYDAAFALGKGGMEAVGYYTFLEQKNESTPAGETGPWLLYYQGEPTKEACELVYRDYDFTCG
ncbi:hypothetical protein MMC12_002889 [Toensbergia leucococca]|nr:hypothetical protein [Toensbergia leucococca]